ncbi:hypothetical protein Pla22_16820 [Rubripirellula amarantea]|uniref:Zinc-binding metallo-peptidase n=1 Tax=Rubripirellula amarantea TaxID=2527999 RepID=A0A5C5WTP5_9BACT|nr:putative zinc-binding metallopeptidase [Rubripirellula amarantea]TWT54047.1 hypothetical protein Pla22_16820 [Rubripirellula amarantea]
MAKTKPKLKKPPRSSRSNSTEPIVDLNRLTDDQLLDMRMCDLPIKIGVSPLEKRIKQLYDELARRGLRFRPHCWLSEEWFSPDDIPGIAIPFYLAHPRLIRLERKQLLEVEGGTHDWCMRILRHEAGHAIDTAYRLRRKAAFRELFGKPSRPYPTYYHPMPSSKDFVLHLEMWYAQAHPLEDFAETFAVWLRPGSRWRSRYKDWPAIKKLHLMHDMMESVADKKPVVTSKARPYALSQIRKTLRTHYAEKREHYGVSLPSIYDNDLRKLFSSDPIDKRNVTAAMFLTRIRSELRLSVAKWTGEYTYTIDQVVQEMIERSRELKLRLGSSPEEAKRDAMILVAVRTTNFLHEGRRHIAV